VCVSLKFVRNGWCESRPIVDFPLSGHHSLVDIELFCLITQAQRCEYLSYSDCPATTRLGEVEV